MNTTQNQTRALAAVECTPWCRDGSGHTDALHPDDQACISDEHTVELTTEPHMRLAGASTNLETLEMYLLREHDARSTTIEISKGDMPIAEPDAQRGSHSAAFSRAWPSQHGFRRIGLAIRPNHELRAVTPGSQATRHRVLPAGDVGCERGVP